MNEFCADYTFQGFSDCIKALAKPCAMLVTTKGTTQSKADFATLAPNKAIVSATAGSTGIYISFSNGLTKTTDDINILTSNQNRKIKGSNALPSMMGFATISACDYKTLFDSEDKEFDFQIFLDGSVKLGTNVSDGTVKGMRGRMAFVYDTPPENIQESHPVHIFFDDWEEFKDFYVAQMNFKKTELKDSVPIGIGLSLNTVYTAGIVLLNSFVRCFGTPYNGFASAAEWTVINSDANDVAVTLATVANGVCSVTIKQDSGTTPINLTSGQWVDLQGVVDDGTYQTHVSEVFRITAP